MKLLNRVIDVALFWTSVTVLIYAAFRLNETFGWFVVGVFGILIFIARLLTT